MELPFTHEEFLDVFGHYNEALWPAEALLWLVTARLAWIWMTRRRLDSRAAFGPACRALGLVRGRLPLDLLPPDQSGGHAVRRGLHRAGGAVGLAGSKWTA